MSIHILSTGTELSSGRSRDSNGPFIARNLSEIGLDVASIGILPDDPDAIVSELKRLLALRETQAIIITGGLGPTADDHTVDVLANLTGSKIIEDADALKRLEAASIRFRGRIKLESARRQVRVLEGARVLKNEKGLAPGLLIENQSIGQRIIAAMPGVPSEMTAMFSGELLPEIVRRFVSHDRERLVFLVYGVGESNVQATLFGDQSSEGLIASTSLPQDFRWGVTAQPGFCKLFFETRDSEILRRIDAIASESYGNAKLSEPVEDILHSFCIENKIKLALAESCTGGLISRILTDRSGASEYFKGSVVAYANDVKQKTLGVSEEMIKTYGAVSAECAGAMATGVLGALGADASLSITGIAGPEGGTREKPVGTVFCAAAKRGAEPHVIRWNLPFDRDRIREYSSRTALLHLYNYLRER